MALTYFILGLSKTNTLWDTWMANVNRIVKFHKQFSSNHVCNTTKSYSFFILAIMLTYSSEIIHTFMCMHVSTKTCMYLTLKYSNSQAFYLHGTQNTQSLIALPSSTGLRYACSIESGWQKWQIHLPPVNTMKVEVVADIVPWRVRQQTKMVMNSAHKFW